MASREEKVKESFNKVYEDTKGINDTDRILMLILESINQTSISLARIVDKINQEEKNGTGKDC